VALPAPEDEVLSVHEALEGLAAEDATAAELVKLRYFVGLSMPEAAEVLGLSLRSAERLWTFARAWLRHELRS
jgi:DNA-directed RNA polymerase specialized sigma24 family protein